MTILVVLALVVTGFLPLAWAQSAEREFELVYAAPAECADERAFLRGVQTRTSRRLEQQRPRVEVTIAPQGKRYLAEMRLVTEGSSPALRRLQSEDCAEAVRAMAIVVALALDALVEQREATEQGAAGDQNETAEQAEAEAGAAEPWAAEPRLSRELPAKEKNQTPSPWSFSLGLYGVADAALSPEWSLGGLVLGALSHAEWEGMLRVSVGYRQDAGAQAGAHTLSASLVSGLLEVCPVGVSVSSWLWLYGCGSWETGRYAARGESGFVTARTQSVWWNSLGAAGRLDLRFADAWSWELSGHLVFPLLNQAALTTELAGTPDQIVLFEIPVVSPAVSTGLRVRF